MFKKNIIMTFVLLVFILSMGSIYASENVTGDVEISNQQSEINDSGYLSVSDESTLQSTISVSGNTFNDIDKAISKANKNDIIKLRGNYVGSGSPIYVDKDLTLEGDSNKVTLDAKSLSAIILSGNGVKITLKNIIFKNSNTIAVNLNGGVVENCNFENNGGYAISAGDSISENDLTVKNSVFNRNDGGIYSILKSLTIEKSTFINNKESAIDYNLI